MSDADDRRRPTPKMVRLYHAVCELIGSEPPEMWVFAPDLSLYPPEQLVQSTPTLKHVMVWPADDEIDVTTFQTLGMSERTMSGADYCAELHMGVRAYLQKEDRRELGAFLANVAEYPFDHGRTLDRWHVLNNPGDIPQFPGCRHLLLHPRFTDAGFDTIDDEDGPVRVFYVVPITPLERHLLVDHGRQSFIEYAEAEGIDLLTDRTDPPGAPKTDPQAESP